MATPTHGNTTGSGNFDMHQSEEMWKNFNRIAKWIIILTIIVLVGMASFLTGNHAPLP
jgi:hypothetical protein